MGAIGCAQQSAATQSAQPDAPDLSPRTWPAGELERYWTITKAPAAHKEAIGTRGLVAGTTGPVAIRGGIEALRRGGTAASDRVPLNAAPRPKVPLLSDCAAHARRAIVRHEVVVPPEESMEDAPVAANEARQAARSDAVTAVIDRRVNAEIAEKAAASSTTGEARIGEVADRLRDNAIDVTAKRQQVLGNARAVARGAQFMDYGFYVLYSLLAMRLGLGLIAAESTNGFVRLIGAVTAPFYAPFRGIVPSVSAEGGFTLVLPIVVALLAYAILHAGIRALLRMVGNRQTEI
jgi:hypothetical protein